MPKEFPEVGFEPGYYPDNEEGAELFNQGLEAGGEIVDLLLLACDNDAHKARVFYTQWEESTRFPAYVKDLMNGLIEGGNIALQGAQDGQALKEGQESSRSVYCVDSLVDELNKEGPNEFRKHLFLKVSQEQRSQGFSVPLRSITFLRPRCRNLHVS